MDGIREPIMGSLMDGNNLITAAVVPTSAAIGLHFYPIWEAASMDEWLYNGGQYQLIVLHFLIGIWCYSRAILGTELSFGNASLDSSCLFCTRHRRYFDLGFSIVQELLGSALGQSIFKLCAFRVTISLCIRSTCWV